MTVIKHTPTHNPPAVPTVGGDERHLAVRISELVLHHGLPDIRTSQMFDREALDSSRTLVNTIQNLHEDLEEHERLCDETGTLSDVLDLEQQRWRITEAAEKQMAEALARMHASGVKVKIVVNGVGNTPVVGPSFGLRWRTTRV